MTIVAKALAASLTITEASADTLTIHFDLGGDIGRRGNRISSMIEAGDTVVIKGTCYSACTMYLAIPETCVEPTAQLGFHRASNYGTKLAPDQFEFWSQVIASHYPAKLRKWYLASARYSALLIEMTGQQAIDLGARACR